MKLTKEQLFQAIGKADEELIHKTEPAEEQEKRPFMLTRRIAEMTAVAAAVCIFAGGGLLIRRLHTAGNPVGSSMVAETETAEDVLNRFFEAYKQGDTETIRKTSLIEQNCYVYFSEEDPETAEKEIESSVAMLEQDKDQLVDLSCGAGTECYGEFEEIRQMQADLLELRAYQIEKLSPLDAARLRKGNAVTEWGDRIDGAYRFPVTTVIKSETGGTEKDTEMVYVFRFDGEWRVDLFSGMTDEERNELERYRAGEKAVSGRNTETEQTAESAADSTKEIPVPDFVGMEYDQAEIMAKSIGFVLKKHEIDDEAAEGTVLSQSAPAGDPLTAGYTILVIVSRGQHKANAVRVPFSIPAGVKGKFHIVLYQNDMPAFTGASFDPEYAAGATSLAVEGTGSADMMAVLVNDEVGVSANIGMIHIDFDKQTIDMLSVDTDEAFRLTDSRRTGPQDAVN